MRRHALVLAVSLAAGHVAPAGASSAPRCRHEVERVDGGTWTTVPVAGIAGDSQTWLMDVDESDPSFVVVADSDGVLVSRDGGCRWSRSITFQQAGAERLDALDVEITRAEGRRYFHVLALGYVRMTLLSSSDDGRTWSAAELPPAVSATSWGTELTAARAGDPRLYLVTRDTPPGTGWIFASEDAGRTWRRTALTAAAGSSGACVPDDACTAPQVGQLAADPSHAPGLWALAYRPLDDTGLVRSPDEGRSWEEVRAPLLNSGPTLLDVAGAERGETSVLLLGAFGGFALSRNAGATWEVGEFPELSSGPYSTRQSFDVAHTAGARTFATLLGQGRSAGWAGNVMTFDGREWANVAPDAYRGFAPDAEGTERWFLELTGAGDSFVMLSSLGLLATFRPGR